MRVPWLSLRRIFVGLAVIIAVVQMSAVTLASLPPNRYSDATAPHTTYLDPYFTQNWRLFAPNPVAEDRNLVFQGSYVRADGTQGRTPWVDWTDVELDLIHHRLVGGRAGYVTNKMFGSLGSRFAALTPEERRIAADTDQETPPSWSALRALLAEPSGDNGAVLGYVRHERAVTQLATAVIQGRWPDLDITAVRYSARWHAVVPYAARNGSDAEREAARPAAIERRGGWRIPTGGSAAERKVIADFDRRHR